MSDLICVSHISWDVMQGQQQYLPSRLSRQRRVLFVEESVGSSDGFEPRLETLQVELPGLPSVTVVRLASQASQPIERYHDGALTRSVYLRLLNEYIKAERYRDVILWLYSASAVGYADALSHKLLVYDAIDQVYPTDSAPLMDGSDESPLLKRANIIIYRRNQVSPEAVAV